MPKVEAGAGAIGVVRHIFLLFPAGIRNRLKQFATSSDEETRTEVFSSRRWNMMNAQTLNQARSALIDAAQQRIVLTNEVREQKRKIVDLEREVQDLAASVEQARQALADARNEI